MSDSIDWMYQPETPNVSGPSMSRVGTIEGGMKIVNVWPDETHDGYWHARVVSAGNGQFDCVETRRPILKVCLGFMLCGMGVDCSQCEWSKSCYEGIAAEDAQVSVEPVVPVVYFVEAVGMGIIKIGYARRLSRRMVQLRCGCPSRLKVVATLVAKNKKLEREMHLRFAHLRSHGEWFRAEPELCDFIASIGVHNEPR